MSNYALRYIYFDCFSFIRLSDSIILHAQNHKAYSVLHFFHSSDKKEAFALNLTNFDEVLSVLLHSIPVEHQPSFNVLMGLRKAISTYLVTLPEAFITPGDETPPQHELITLETKGIKLIQGKTVDLAYEKIKSRRRLLLSLIKDDGWEWNDLQADSYSHEMIFTAK